MRSRRCSCGRIYTPPPAPQRVLQSVRDMRRHSPTKCPECLTHSSVVSKKATLRRARAQRPIERIYDSRHWRRQVRPYVYQRDNARCHYCSKHVAPHDYVAAHLYQTTTILAELGLAACYDLALIACAHRRCAESNPPPPYPARTQQALRLVPASVPETTTAGAA